MRASAPLLTTVNEMTDQRDPWWKKRTLRVCAIGLLALVLQLAFWWELYADRWLVALVVPSHWRFAWLFLFVGVSIAICEVAFYLYEERRRLLGTEPLCLYAPWFWVLTFGSWGRVVVFLGVTLAGVLATIVTWCTCLSDDVWSSQGVSEFLSGIDEFLGSDGDHLLGWCGIGVVIWVFFTGWCFWVAGDVLGGVGGGNIAKRSFFEEQNRNNRRTAVLIAFSAFLLIAIGGAIGVITQFWSGEFSDLDDIRDWLISPDQWDVERAAIGAGVFFAVWLVSFPILLRFGSGALLKFVRAEQPTQQERQRLENTVEEMKVAALVPGIQWSIIRSDVPNAFALGYKPGESHVVVTSGLLDTLNRDELQAVVAHELAHIRHRDTLFVTMALLTVYYLLFFTGLAVLLLVIAVMIALGAIMAAGAFMMKQDDSKEESSGAPLIGLLIAGAGLVVAAVLFVYSVLNLAILIIGLIGVKFTSSGISQRREFSADAAAVELTRQAGPLASALEKISAAHQDAPARLAFFTPLYFSKPRCPKGAVEWLLAFLFQSHPKVDERIRRLRGMNPGTGQPSSIP